jgi:hypothetical protein
MDIIKSLNNITVTTPFWDIIFNISRDGCIGNINFPNGSRRNILVEPFYTMVDEYYDVNDSSITYNLVNNDKKAILEIRGMLRDGEGRCSSIGFSHSYIFKEEYVKVLTELNFLRDIEVREVEVGSTCLNSRMCYHVCRPPADEDYSWMNFSASSTKKIENDGEIVSQFKNVPYNCYFYDMHVEGVDFEPDSNIGRWDCSFSKDGSEGLYYAKKTDKGIYFKRSPLTVSNARKVKKGTYSFGYYIGLPKIFDKVQRKWHFISTKTWPTDEQISNWAQKGINLLKLHNDYSRDGVYWRNGCYPPYDGQNMSEMRRVIDTAHNQYMKVMLYFSLYELHPEAPEFGEARKWCREPFER